MLASPKLRSRLMFSANTRNVVPLTLAASSTGPAAQPEFARAHLGVTGDERVVGLIHIGQRGAAPPERPRPDIAAKTVFLA